MGDTVFDLKGFIEILNKSSSFDDLKLALETYKEDLHISKLVLKTAIDSSELVLNKNSLDVPSFSYSKNGYDYLFYKVNDNYEFTLDDANNIEALLRILAMEHQIVISEKKLVDSELYSHQANIYNVTGYIRKVCSMNPDYSKYNSYYINLKAFGLINRLFGPNEGDYAIKHYAKLLNDFANPDEAVGHLGGDNFVAFIKRFRHEEFVNLASKFTIKLKNKANELEEITLSGVIGYYEFENNQLVNERLISYPAMACQYARNNKKPIIKITKELIESVNSVKDIEKTFKDELNKGNFVIYYQPKFDIVTSKIFGVEALARWHKNGEIVSPGVFVPILEKNGEIIDLDLYVLETLCRDIRNYRSYGYKIVPASCNISRRDFEDPNLEDKIIRIINEYGILPGEIIIEVTETSNLEEKDRLAKFIEKMNKNGIYTSVDDFGTGYSTLSVLRDFKVNEIKIDRSFINRKIEDSDKIIIGSIINIANKLKIQVVFEGIETIEQAKFVLSLGCSRAQGFLYSKPLPKLEFEAKMQEIGTIYD